MEQLTLEFSNYVSVVAPKYEKQPRPEHKPYEPNTINLKDYFILQGAFLDWTWTFGAFSSFLDQHSKDPKLQKARDWKYDGKVIKVPAYHWREFEGNSAIYNAWRLLFNEHLLGLTTNHFKAHKHERDFITRRIEDGMCDSQNFTHAFFETLRGLQDLVNAKEKNYMFPTYTGRDLDNAWKWVESVEKLDKGES